MLSTKDIRSLYSGVLMDASLNEKKVLKLKASRMAVLLLYYACQHGIQLINHDAPNTFMDIAPDGMVADMEQVLESLFEAAGLKEINQQIIGVLKK